MIDDEYRAIRVELKKALSVVENAKWLHKGVQFATVHVPGSQNNFLTNDEAAAREAINRNRAAIAWLQSTFADAKASQAEAVVIAMHAQLFLDGEGDEEFGQPVRGGPGGAFYIVMWIPTRPGCSASRRSTDV